MKIDISQGELLLGRSVGHEIISAFQYAKQFISIISQQVAPQYAELLCKKRNEGLNVRLITAENIDPN